MLEYVRVGLRVTGKKRYIYVANDVLWEMECKGHYYLS